VTNCLVGKRPEASRQHGWGDSNSTPPVPSTPGQEAVDGATCGFDERSVTALVRRCPRFAIRLRTQCGPDSGPSGPDASEIQAHRIVARNDLGTVRGNTLKRQDSRVRPGECR
jgi:hypothetical protein